MARVYDKKQVVIDNTAWWPIAPTINCSSFTVRNPPGLDVLLRTQAADPTTEDTLWSGAQEVVIAAPKGTGMCIVHRFLIGVPILYARVAVPGVVTLICTYLE